MKIQIEQNILNAALTMISKIVSSKNTIDIKFSLFMYKR